MRSVRQAQKRENDKTVAVTFSLQVNICTKFDTSGQLIEYPAWKTVRARFQDLFNHDLEKKKQNKSVIIITNQA